MNAYGQDGVANTCEDSVAAAILISLALVEPIQADEQAARVLCVSGRTAHARGEGQNEALSECDVCCRGHERSTIFNDGSASAERGCPVPASPSLRDAGICFVLSHAGLIGTHEAPQLLSSTDVNTAQVAGVLNGTTSLSVRLGNRNGKPQDNVLILGLSNGVLTKEYHATVSASQSSLSFEFPDSGPISSAGPIVTPAAAVGPKTAASPDVVTCSTYFYKSLGHPWATLGGTYATTDGGTQDFVFKTTTTSTVGVGASPTGAAGSFSANGTQTLTSSAKSSFPTQDDSAGSHHWYSEFTANEYQTRCIQSLTGQTTYSYFTSSDGWYGGQKVKAVGTLNAPHCAPYPGGSTFTLDSSKASTYDAGMTLPYINFSASTQTGYTTSTEAIFHQNVPRNLCGQYGGPAAAPGQLQVEP